ncbi:hypothetical protein EVAR_100940_1 [Eumeta japonica]|uniref:Uncharacterized protein n=1 Tax=Eumeta variegata TaxID=151549 RepID=A0A4C2A6M5_EUMVA|nr:hypothetical protein EVAR_100940_1 [Eumeta japonica]
MTRIRGSQTIRPQVDATFMSHNRRPGIIFRPSQRHKTVACDVENLQNDLSLLREFYCRYPLKRVELATPSNSTRRRHSGPAGLLKRNQATGPYP